MTFENGSHEAPHSAKSDEWGLDTLRTKVRTLIDGMKQTSARDAVEQLRLRAGETKVQAQDYIGRTTVRDLANDIVEMVKRHPARSAMMGLVLGLLMSRRRGG